MANQTVYLITPTHILKNFTLAADRRYFSNPVAVEPLYSELSTGLTIVHDPVRGHTYPTDPKWVVGAWRLSKSQRLEVA